MTEVSNNCKNKAAELRNERVRMIRNKIRETGQDVNDWDAKVASFDLRGSQYILFFFFFFFLLSHCFLLSLFSWLFSSFFLSHWFLPFSLIGFFFSRSCVSLMILWYFCYHNKQIVEWTVNWVNRYRMKKLVDCSIEPERLPRLLIQHLTWWPCQLHFLLQTLHHFLMLMKFMVIFIQI